MEYIIKIERERKRGEKMDAKAKEAKKAYMKKWREKNKDKIKASQEKYWKKKSEEMKS